jgi:spondin N
MQPKPRILCLTAAGMALLLSAASAGAATPTAQYTVTFDAAWSQATHPASFPPGPHWSPLVGGTHNASVSFWGAGQIASQGIEDMAELGATTPLANEVNAAITAGTAASVILGGGISPSPGSTSVSFTIQQGDPLVTLVSMIAPSPDWFVGVSGLPLLENGEWVNRKTVTLWLYDAGSDSGTNYTSPNQDTNPQVPIALHTTLPGYNGVPMGTFTFTRTDTAVPAAGPWGVAWLAAALLVASAFVLRREREVARTPAA